MSSRKILSVFTVLSFVQLSFVNIVASRDYDRHDRYQFETSAINYSAAKDPSHPAYKLNQMIESQKHATQMELKFRQMMREQQFPSLKAQEPSFKLNLENTLVLKPPAPQTFKAPPPAAAPKNVIQNLVIKPIAQVILSGFKAVGLAFKALAGITRTITTKAWEATRAVLTAVLHAFRGHIHDHIYGQNPAAGSAQVPQRQESLKAGLEEAQIKLTDHQDSYIRLESKTATVTQHIQVLKNEYNRLGVSDPQIENAIQALGRTQDIRQLSQPLQALIQKSKTIEEAIANQDFTQAGNLLKDFNQSLQRYSQQSVFLTRQVNQKAAILLSQINQVAAITQDPSQAPQATVNALDHLRSALKQGLITPEVYAPLRVGLIRGLPKQMAEAEKLQTSQDFSQAFEAEAIRRDLRSMRKGVTKGALVQNEERDGYTTSGHLLGYFLSLPSPGLTYTLMARDTAASGYRLYSTKGHEGKLDTALGIAFMALPLARPVTARLSEAVSSYAKPIAAKIGSGSGAVLERLNPFFLQPNNGSRGVIFTRKLINFFVTTEGKAIPNIAAAETSALMTSTELTVTRFARNPSKTGIKTLGQGGGSYATTVEEASHLGGVRIGSFRIIFRTKDATERLALPQANRPKFGLPLFGRDITIPRDTKIKIGTAQAYQGSSGGAPEFYFPER